MTKSKTTKKALLASALSLTVCLAMLIGTTFAWFTDSATSKGNIIKSGNLNIDLQVKKGTSYVSVKESNEAIFNYSKWEPGYTVAKNLMVTTTGNLALKYTMVVVPYSISDDALKLAEVIDVYYAKNEVTADRELKNLNKIGTLKDVFDGKAETVINDTLIPGTKNSAYATIALKMQETAGNEYQNLSVGGGFDIKILATQFTEEADDFGTDYDKNAIMGNILVKGGSKVIDLDQSNVINNGEDGAIQATDGANVTIKGKGIVKATLGETGYSMAVFAEGDGTVVNIESGTFTNETDGTDRGTDLIYAKNGATINISGGTFKAAKPEWTLNCRNATSEIKASTISVTGGAFYKFDPANAMTDDKGAANNPVSYVADGYVSVQKDDWYYVVDKKFENVVTIGTAEELFAFAKDVNENGENYSGKTVMLTNDIDLNNQYWTPIGQTNGYSATTRFQGKFDGNGKTIKNLNVIVWEAGSNEGASYASGLFGFLDNGDGYVQNLTVDGATVSGHHWVGVIAGYLSNSYIENCTVKNATVNCTHKNSEACGDKAGAVVGYVNNGTVKNCKAIKSTVKAGRDAGQIVGCTPDKNKANITGCTAEEVTVSATGDCTGANINNTVIGRLS